MVKKAHSDTTIFLVDDYDIITEIGRAILEEEQYNVIICDNGKEAVDQFRKQVCDLILMDVNMPEMNGPEAAKTIRSMPNGKDVPIIGMTATTISDDIDPCFSAGMNDILIKPFNLDALLAIVTKWIDNNDGTSQKTERSPEIIQSYFATQSTDDDHSEPEPLKYEKALKEFELDTELLSEVILGFLKKLAFQIPDMQQALDNGEIDTLREEAHAIKGGAANLCAEQLSEAAKELEAVCKNADSQKAAESMNNLKDEYNRFKEYVRTQLHISIE